MIDVVNGKTTLPTLQSDGRMTVLVVIIFNKI